MNILIITGGGLDVPFATSYLKDHDYDRVIAADKGFFYALELGIRPDFVLGDFDSLDEASKKKLDAYQDAMDVYPSVKDYTDTHLALEKALEFGADEITILGGTGTRLDHTWANVGLLEIPARQGVPTYIVDAHNRISMWNHGFEIKKEESFGDFVSLIPYTEKVTGLTLRGFFYEVTDFILTIGVSRGISNELIKETASVEFVSGELIMVESLD